MLSAMSRRSSSRNSSAQRVPVTATELPGEPHGLMDDGTPVPTILLVYAVAITIR